jgi:BirA family biotin operon repressor/biotin-[acetyl-CoA-carboxylase] ligase
VLVQGKKIAGVLSEASLRGDALEFAVIGIGFNVNSDVGDFPRELQTSITSLLLSTGTKSDVSEVANDFLERFGRLYRRMTTEGCGFIRTLWESRWAHKGQTLIWEETRGTAQGIADDGSLVLATPEGQVHYISAGDVEPTGPG